MSVDDTPRPGPAVPGSEDEATTRGAASGARSVRPAIERTVAAAVEDRAAVERAIDAVVRRATGAAMGAGRESISIRKQREERHTTHLWIEVGAGPTIRRFFVKRYRPPIERNLFTFVLRSRVEREYSNSRRAIELGIPALPAIGYAIRRRFGVVVDQWIVFEDAGKCRSAAQLIDLAKERGEYEATRRDIAARLAKDLSAMHERGYSHLSMSPRNYLMVLAMNRFVFIDHNASLVFPRSIHTREEALPDLLNLFESHRMFPDDASRAEFLARYAPDAPEFRERVLRAVAIGTRSDRAARVQKLKRAFSR